MSRFSVSGKTTTCTANANLISVRSTATQLAMLEEVWCFPEVGTAWVSPALYLTTVVDTAGTAVAFQKEDPSSGAASITCAVAPTGGTLGAEASQRASLAATAGCGFVWCWPPGQGLIVPASLSAVLRNDGSVGPDFTWCIVAREV